MKAWGIKLKLTFTVFAMTAILLTVFPFPFFAQPQKQLPS